MKQCKACAVVCAVGLGCLLGCGSDDGSGDFAAGQAAYGVRDLKKAEKCIEKSVAALPTDVDRLLLLARVKLDLGDLVAAKDFADKAAGFAGEDSDVILFGAQVAWHMKDYEAAAKGFRSIAANAKLPAAVRSQGFSDLGIVEMSNNNPHFARIDFLKAIRLDYHNASACYHLGLLFRDVFDYREAALEQFEKFVRLEASASPRVQKVQRTIIPALKESIAKALTDRPGVSKRDSAACAAKITKAEAALKKGQAKTARQLYQDALVTDPLSFPAAIGLAKTWPKADATRNGQVKSLEAYRIACSLRPGSISTFLTTGALAFQLGFHAQAVEIYSRAVAAAPNSLEALDGLIRSLRKIGNKAKIAQAYQDYRTDISAKTKRK